MCKLWEFNLENWPLESKNSAASTFVMFRSKMNLHQKRCCLNDSNAANKFHLSTDQSEWYLSCAKTKNSHKSSPPQQHKRHCCGLINSLYLQIFYLKIHKWLLYSFSRKSLLTTIQRYCIFSNRSSCHTDWLDFVFITTSLFLDTCILLL